MGKKKVTYQLDEDLVRAVKIKAAREDKPDYLVVEEALRSHLDDWTAVFERIWARTAPLALSEEEAMAIALEEQRAYRSERRSAEAG